MTTGGIKGVIFDCDGVIADTGKLVTEGLNVAFGQLGRPVATDWKRPPVWKDLIEMRALGQEELPAFSKLFYDFVLPRYEDCGVFPGVPEMLETLAGKFKLGLVSNHPHDSLVGFLEKHGLRGYFSSVHGYNGGKSKPDPYSVNACAESLGIKPAEICGIGDTADDIAAYAAAGLGKIIAVTYGFGEEVSLNAHHYASGPTELLRILEALP